MSGDEKQNLLKYFYEKYHAEAAGATKEEYWKQYELSCRCAQKEDPTFDRTVEVTDRVLNALENLRLAMRLPNKKGTLNWMASVMEHLVECINAEGCMEMRTGKGEFIVGYPFWTNKEQEALSRLMHSAVNDVLKKN